MNARRQLDPAEVPSGTTIQTPGNANLVLDTETDAFTLRSVAQRGVVDLDTSCLRFQRIQRGFPSSFALEVLDKPRNTRKRVKDHQANG